MFSARATVALYFALIGWTSNQAMAQSSGDIRLVGGSTDNEGRVEIYYAGEWGTVCDNSWSFNDAEVVCRQLGYIGIRSYRRRANYYYGQASGRIWMDRVGCTGSELALSSCSFDGWGTHSCDHSDDVGVICCVRPSYGRYCHMRCGVNLTSTSGTIFSPGFDLPSNQYVDNEDCDWYIIPPNENSSVIIEFRSFATDPCCDYLSIYADPPTYSTLVARYSGNLLLYSTLYEGPLRLHFHSDGSAVSKGFSLSYTVVEGIAPRFLSMVNDLHVGKGDKVVLPCKVTGIPQPVVTWYKDGLDIHSVLQSKFALKGNDIIIEDIVEDDFGVFKCKAENYLNSTEQVFQLFVYVAPMIITHPTAIHFENIVDEDINDYDYPHFPNYYYYYHYYYDRYFESGERFSAVFRCDVSGSPKPNVYWKKEGIVLFNPTTMFDWLIISNVNVSDEGSYSCFANNSYGTVESRAASLTIGNVLPCCFSMRLQSHSVLPVGSTSSIRIRLNSIPDLYTLSNVTVTKDGQLQRAYSYRWHYIYIDFALAPNGTGVYGYHLTLSSAVPNSTLVTNSTVSFYLPLIVQVPPHVSIRPSNVILRDFSERLHISCSVYSLQSNPTISWFKDNTPVHSESVIKGTRRTTAYLSVNNTHDVMSHYTCEAVNAAGLRSHSTVTVALRVEEGGWSWWRETLPCSVTCGFTRGIRYKSRRCYNESIRCPGDSIRRTTCYSSLLYCPSERSTMHGSPTTMSELKITSTSSKTTSEAETQPAENELSRGEVAGLSVSLTAVIAVGLSAVLLWLIIRRLRQKVRDTDTTTNTGTSTNTYVAPPYGRRQKGQPNSDSRDEGKSNPSPSLHQGSAYDLDYSKTQKDEDLADADTGEDMKANPAYSTVPAANAHNRRPAEDPVYAETCY